MVARVSLIRTLIHTSKKVWIRYGSPKKCPSQRSIPFPHDPYDPYLVWTTETQPQQRLQTTIHTIHTLFD
jgi:hypothetical protein